MHMCKAMHSYKGTCWVISLGHLTFRTMGLLSKEIAPSYDLKSDILDHASPTSVVRWFQEPGLQQVTSLSHGDKQEDR